MSLSQSDRVAIRKYFCTSALYSQLWPKLENAMTAIQSTATSGGSQADTSSEIAVQTALAELVLIEQSLKDLRNEMGLVKVEEASFDPAMAQYLLNKEGRRQIKILSSVLGCKPKSDFFGAVSYDEAGFPDMSDIW
jgi:hypothetical protein